MVQPTHQQQPSGLRFVLSTLWQYRLLWGAPAVVGLGLAIAYVQFLKVDSWSARQSFIVRDDLLGQSYKPGRFESQESMKSAQETILEISRRPQVIRNTLQQLGPAPGMDWDGKSPLPDEMIESLQDSISLSAPNGAEFGKTEVIVLTAKANSRERSKEFIDVLSKEVVNQVNEIRMLRLRSMEAELIEAHDGAVRQQSESMRALEQLDQLLGPDVGVMNALNDSQAGDTPMKREITQIRAEKRALETELEQAQTTLKALQHVYEQPERIIFLSSDILRQQPALETMKVQLVGLQQSLAQALGTLDEAHPKVIGLRLSVKSMESQIFQSLVGEIEGVQSSITLRERQRQRLSLDIESLERRLVMLSGKRAEHLKLTTEVKQLTDSANRSQASLLEIQSLANATKQVGLMTPVGEPQVASRPDGVGKKVFVAAGGLGGLILGLGLVVLVAPPMPRLDPQSPTPMPAGPPRRLAETEVAEAPQPIPSATNVEPSKPADTPVPSRESAYEQAVDAMRQATETMRSAATIPNIPSLEEALSRFRDQTDIEPKSTNQPASSVGTESENESAIKAKPTPNPLPTATLAPVSPSSQSDPRASAPVPSPVDQPASSGDIPAPRPEVIIPSQPVGNVPPRTASQPITLPPSQVRSTPATASGVGPRPETTPERPLNPGVPTGSASPVRGANPGRSPALIDFEPGRAATGRVRPVDLAKSAEYQAKVDPAVVPVPTTPPQQFAGLTPPPAVPRPPAAPPSAKSPSVSPPKDMSHVMRQATVQPIPARPPVAPERTASKTAPPANTGPAESVPPSPPRRSSAPTDPAPTPPVGRTSMPTVVDNQSTPRPGVQPGAKAPRDSQSSGTAEDSDSGSIPAQIQKLHDTISRLMGPQPPVE